MAAITVENKRINPPANTSEMHKSVPSKTGAKTSDKAPTHVAHNNTFGSSRHCTLSQIVVDVATSSSSQ